ncbi:hypothetical protein AD945_12105 [Gluconobacter albidus]|uniref:Uncharacterized protein n=1 Tax=Gluconobacter albidus TaxID=318683 RepID=A0A149TGE9_9PROT|nr:hypothetical protein [Gluconobacter albidus]KXV46848.1 hypothetical protein AD945_12105 [Gluconobacter albidus]
MMKNGIAWGVGASALVVGLGVLGLTMRHPQAAQDPCAAASDKRPQNCPEQDSSSGHFVYVPRSRFRDSRASHGDSEAESAGHAGFGESAGGHAGGGE